MGSEAGRHKDEHGQVARTNKDELRAEARGEIAKVLGKLADLKTRSLRLVDECRELLVSTRAMWEGLIEQDDVADVTECASMEEVRRRRVEEIGMVERDFKSAQESVEFCDKEMARFREKSMRLEALNG